jgi:hypothetical protein
MALSILCFLSFSRFSPVTGSPEIESTYELPIDEHTDDFGANSSYDKELRSDSEYTDSLAPDMW